jgi:aspartyl-tRNA(Asn)/glutamyl-tRNA(Gln) amidotransferase subunit A
VSADHATAAMKLETESAPELWQLSATELASAYRDGTTTPEAVLRVMLERIDHINRRINAVVTLDFESARAAAKASTRRWREGKPLGALDGVPITVKDNILVRGLRATWGSRLFADFVPDADEQPITRLRDAGVVILGKTNVPEFTVQGYTDNLLFGATRNPWDLTLTPGGSSGGAVAAVATGIGAIAIGTDGGGSIRRPAAHTGLVGFKPSRDTVPRGGGFPAILHDFEVVGPIARRVDDIVSAMRVMAGNNWPEREDDAPGAPRRILYIPTFSNAPVDPAIAASVAEVAAELARHGHHVEQADHFTLAEPIAGIWPVISQTGVAWLMAQHGERYHMIAPALAEMATNGKRYTATDYLNAMDIVRAVAREFDSLFEKFDVLLTPATAAMPWPAQATHPEIIAGQPVGPRGHAVFTPFANALGLPAISLPSRSWPQNLPIGFQLVANRNRDAALLAFAGTYEKHASPFRWPAAAVAAD